MQGRHDLTDAECRSTRRCCLTSRGAFHGWTTGGRSAGSFILRTGTPWRDLPECYGPYTTVCNRYNRWAKQGVWERLFGRWRRARRDLFISWTPRRAHQHAAGGKKGVRTTPSTGVTKIHATAWPARFRKAFLVERQPSPTAAMTPAPSSNALPTMALAPTSTQRDRREQRSVSHDLYRQRNLVERFFTLKHFRGIATRYHKPPASASGSKLMSTRLVFLAACLRLIGLVEPLIFQVVIDRILPFQFVVHLAFGPFLRRRLRVQFDAGATASDKSAELARASAMRFVRWTPLMGCQRLVGVSGTVRPHLGPTVLMSIR